MSKAKIRRFSGFQLVLHWVVALPYMALLASGALMMLHRAGLAAWVPVAMLGTVHRWIGIAMAAAILQALIATTVGGRWKIVGRDFLHWMTIRPREIVWLLKAPLNTFFPRLVPMPPAGRFNAGQKLHGLFILMAITGFIATGGVMILRPARLLPWVVHTWLFFGAVGFLGLHLFLGVINPVTRRALGGIFSGHVPLDYAHAHHSLDVPDAPVAHAHHPAVVSWKAMLLVILAVAGAGLWWWQHGGRDGVQTSMAVGRQHMLIMPGMLIAAHADDPRTNRCETCHVGLGPPKESACLSCHTEIVQAMGSHTGFHGQLTGACASCHADHKGRDADLRNLDTRTFNHQLARFSLQGAHRALECDQCHVQHSGAAGQRRFVGIETSDGCAQCHADPHAGQFQPKSCTDCHNEQGWKGKQLLFDHNRDATFKIDALHGGVACASCHKESEGHRQFRLLATNCESCHLEVAQAMAGHIGSAAGRADPHSGRVACAECHAPSIRAPEPARYAAACEKCHTPLYRNLFFNLQRSLDEREAAAGRAIKKIEATDPAGAQALTRRVAQVHRAGVHNAQESLSILDEILAGPPQSAPRKNP